MVIGNGKTHFSPTDITKLKNFSVVRSLDSELSRLEESQRQDLEKLLQEYEVLFPDVVLSYTRWNDFKFPRTYRLELGFAI